MSATKREQALSLKILPRPALAREVAAFLDDCKVRNLSGNTVRIYHHWLKSFQGWVRKPVMEITPDDLRRYFLALQEAGHNPGGQHQAFRVLRCFFKWLVAEGVLEASPMERLKPPRLREQPLDPVPLADVRAMMDACRGKGLLDRRDAALLTFLLDTGARASEALAVDIEDVSLDGTVILRQTKGGRERPVFLGARARKLLWAYLRVRGEVASGPLWAKADGSRLTYWGLRQVLRRRAEAAGVPCPSAHAFRRSFCLTMLRGGADLISVKRLAGHQDLATTQRYLRQLQDDLRAVHATCSPADRL